MAKQRPPLERVARVLCRQSGFSENIAYEGRPMWEQFVDKGRAVMEALLDGASEDERRVLGWWQD